MPEGQQAEDAFVGVGATRGALRGHHIYIPSAAFSVLLIDEGLPDHPDEGMRSILLELLEHRYDTASTVFSTKSREEGLASKARIRDDADAIMDRIVHNTICVDTGTHNMLEHATMSQQRNSQAGVDGPHHDDHWPPQAISLAPNRKIGWPSHLRILMHTKIALMEISHEEEDAGGQGANIVKSWVRPEGVGERAYKRREGAVLKRTSKSYINAQMTYWGGSFDEPRGGQLRLIKMTPKDTPEWDFDAPDAFIDLKKDEIAKLKGFLDEEFRRGGLGDTFWVSVPDQAIADALGRLLGDEEAQVVDVEKLTAAMSLSPELVASILKSDQAEIILQLRERSRRIEVLDELEWLIFHENTVESSFQKLLEKNPWVFGGEVVKADELRNIGTSDQIDIPIVRGDGSMVIVELKRAAATSIDRNDHGYPVLTGDVHLAVQQAQRYLYELDRLADTLMLKHGFDARRATALVVIGVSPDLPERESDKFRESFRIYNSHLARIQVTTYDQLLQNARRLTELRSPENTVNG